MSRGRHTCSGCHAEYTSRKGKKDACPFCDTPFVIREAPRRSYGSWLVHGSVSNLLDILDGEEGDTQ